jgi:very-short-patch-repair endonuclease
MPVDPRREAQTQRLKRRQHAAASWDQLRAVGWTRSQIATRIDRGEWHRAFPRAYILGVPELIPLAMESAALLSFGDDTALGHRTSTAMWDLLRPWPRTIDLIVPRAAVRARPGVRAHLVRSLDAKDVRVRHGLRVTSPARTVIDLAIDASSSELEYAIGEAVARRLMRDDELVEALDRTRKNHPGAARLRACLDHDPDLLLHTQSVAERVAYPLIVNAGLPRPGLNQNVEGLKVDLHWPAHKLIVEVDGFQFHASRHAFENDRRRDQILTAAGYTVIRITWLQLTNEPYRVIAAIAQALGRAATAA